MSQQTEQIAGCFYIADASIMCGKFQSTRGDWLVEIRQYFKGDSLETRTYWLEIDDMSINDIIDQVNEINRKKDDEIPDNWELKDFSK